MPFKLGMEVYLWMAYLFFTCSCMLVSMTLIFIEGHNGSAEENVQRWIISTAKQLINIKLATTVGHFFTRRWPWKHVYGLTILFTFSSFSVFFFFFFLSFFLILILLFSSSCSPYLFLLLLLLVFTSNLRPTRVNYNTSKSLFSVLSFPS